MELDLNQEPLDQTPTSVIGFDSILDELESTHGRIEERIRHLEAVTSRARQRQRWRRGHNPVRIDNIIADVVSTPSAQNEGRVLQEDTGSAVQERTVVLAELTTANAQNEGRMPREEAGVAVQERPVNNGKTGKRKSSHLVAKALGMDPYIDEAAQTNTGNFFDCNICLDMAKDPILTCCGHLFCWPCFYQVSCAYSNVRECPICKGEVAETGIIPIYGSQDVSSSSQLDLKEAGLTIPPRPQARRVESLRQQLISRGATSSPIRDIRRFGVTATDRTRVSANQSRHSRSQVLPDLETENSQHNRSQQLSRLLVEGAASFSSLSSALNSAMDSAERLVGDLEAYVRPQQPQPVERLRELLDPLHHIRDSPSIFAATEQSGRHTPDVAANNSAATASVSPLGVTNEATAVIDSGIRTTYSSVQTSSTEPSLSSSRTDALGLPDLHNRGSNGRRRRRLRR